ncbi:MAG: hypothetical protein WCC36_02260 [Gammaproteobacteria bacterium]
MDAHINDSHGHWVDEMGEIAEELIARTEYGKNGTSVCPPLWASLNRRLAALQGKITDSEDG